MSETTRIRLDKQIQKAPFPNQFPLSDTNGELQFTDIGGVIKQGETLTHLNSVEVSGGTLIIKYTPEDGNQQVVSTPLNFLTQDIRVSDAKMDNPSSGVYRLIITESNGTTYPVDLSALLAVVSQNTTFLSITGNGTPTNPLKVDLTPTFWNSIPKRLDNFDDVYIDDSLFDQEVAKGGTTILVFDKDIWQWTPKTLGTLENFKEASESFMDLRDTYTVSLRYRIDSIAPESIKVYRNGLRQFYGEDYVFGEQYGDTEIFFFEPFTDRMMERVIVDYRLQTAFMLAA